MPLRNSEGTRGSIAVRPVQTSCEQRGYMFHLERKRDNHFEHLSTRKNHSKASTRTRTVWKKKTVTPPSIHTCEEITCTPSQMTVLKGGRRLLLSRKRWCLGGRKEGKEGREV